MSVFEAKKITKEYNDANNKHTIFKNIDLKIENGESVLLIGNSGCGKSTFLQIAGLIQKQTSGDILIDDKSTKNITDNKKNELLKEKIGFIYQFHYLFNDFTAIENLVIPQLIKGIDKKKAEQEASRLLKILKLEHKANAMPNELSGGERQRIAIARAIIKKPILILADEPTGNLDPEMSNFVVEEMLNIVRQEKIALLMVSHCRDFINKFDNTYSLEQNGLVKIKK